MYIAKETYVYRERYYSTLYRRYQHRPTPQSKETYSSLKRDLLLSQKRPTPLSKETYCSAKIDLLFCEKRSILLSKETDSTRNTVRRRIQGFRV